MCVIEKIKSWFKCRKKEEVCKCKEKLSENPYCGITATEINDAPVKKRTYKKRTKKVEKPNL